MRIIFLGDIVGRAAREKLSEKLPSLIKDYSVDFTIVNGENSADDGRGITNLIAQEFFEIGVDVISTGNHVWDQKEALEFIKFEKRLLRPQNLEEGSPGNGYGIFESKNNKRVAVINLMGNVFMKKCNDVFAISKKFMENYKFIYLETMIFRGTPS